MCPDPPPLCDIPSGCCSFTGPWTVTLSSLRMLRRVAAFCRPLRPVLLLVSFPRSRSPVVGVLGLCWMWRDVPFARQRRPPTGRQFRSAPKKHFARTGPVPEAPETIFRRPKGLEKTFAITSGGGGSKGLGGSKGVGGVGWPFQQTFLRKGPPAALDKLFFLSCDRHVLRVVLPLSQTTHTRQHITIRGSPDPPPHPVPSC